jgi:hypothetical protein
MCQKTYRVVVVWKDLEVSRGQQTLFEKDRCFFYITSDEDSPPETIEFEANKRCDQENVIQQHKSIGRLDRSLGQSGKQLVHANQRSTAVGKNAVPH